MMNNIYIYTQLFSTTGPELLVDVVERLVYFLAGTLTLVSLTVTLLAVDSLL